MGFELNERQSDAVEMSQQLFSIINGSAGTGKTTIIKEIAKNINDSTVRLTCPTGKAAARLREASGIPTATLHSIMAYNGEDFMIKDLSPYTIIIDEASMVDSFLMSSVIARRPHRICLIGDQGQLPPVGFGSPFHDIVKYKPEYVTTLDICYRNTEAVFSAASDIRAGKIPPNYAKSDNEEWVVGNTGNAEQTEATLLKAVESGKIDFQQDIILVTRNGSEEQPCTRQSLNKKIANMLIPRGENDKWKVGDRGICLKNHSEADIWNGSTFTVSAINEDGGVWIKGDIPFNIEGQVKDEQLLEKEILKDCDYAYALTIHKSQGSQYRNVIFCCLAQDSYRMLHNSLIYTAVTRTKKMCYVMGDVRSFNESVMKFREKNTIIDLFNR